jgi:hypothetical protein
VEVVKMLLADERVGLSDWNNYAVVRASFNGHVEVVKLLLADGRVNSAVSKESFKHFIAWNREKLECSDLVKRALLDLTSLNEDCIEEALLFLRPMRASLCLQVKWRLRRN